ncbi:hypothetical protein CI109_103476 [Kwoniella shandongensis]|uniref:Uncharacterized protein n=1 Tax=Kwoniella shandongensis TaxID=1734106 RepID=A0A5M6C0F5_9TREE|nr:uncharacterized protein CI109_004621 [Kwoniella shandongensis]KAA5527085.1 hypothetical protein CI109_004621 [Kwoniella shandongensis]
MSRRSSSPATNHRGATPNSPRGRGSSPRPPPSYARSSLDRSPSVNPLILDERPRVPPPIYLRSSSPQPQSAKGFLKIHVPAWGVNLVRPPRTLELHPLEHGGAEREPPCEDTVLSGALEVIMKERRRVQAISVGIQSVCRLFMGQRGWEEDGIFERGVEVLSGDAEGIWLEKGSQSFSFSLLLPATLATTDFHQFGRVSYILTARVEGIPASTSFSSIFKASSTPNLNPDIPNVGDFERVIARSDKLATSNSGGLGANRAANASRESVLGLGNMSLEDPNDGASAIAVGEGSPSLSGLYTRRQSMDIGTSPRVPPLSLSPSEENDRQSVSSPKDRTEKSGWLKGDLSASKHMIVHAVPSSSGGVSTLDLRKEGFVNGIGTWRFSATSDVFGISSVILLSITLPAPSPSATIFLTRLVLVQNYKITSPRTPNSPPVVPEAPRNHVLYQVGRPHKPGDRFPGRNIDCLWRGPEAGGNGNMEEGWKIRAVARMPNHDKIRPSTNEGTITPIRVWHDLLFQVFYSLDQEDVSGKKIDGPGELRMMSVKMPIQVPSCCCTLNALSLPTYETAHRSPQEDIDAILSSPVTSKQCMCGATFAELGEAAMKRLQVAEQDELECTMRGRANEAAAAAGSKEEEAARERDRPSED